VSEPAVSLSYFDPAHGLSGTARAGHTLLFEGAHPTAVDEGPELEEADGVLRAVLDGHFDLRFTPCTAAVDLGGVRATVCRVVGQVGGQAVECLGTRAETIEPPSWEKLSSVRSITAVFDPGHAFLALAERPLGAAGHGEEEVHAALIVDGEVKLAEDARISTVYDGEGRQRSAGLELWMPEEDMPRRLSGTVVAGSSLEMEGLRVHAAVFRWRFGDREGTGAYELMVREETPAAA
jgi:hypothetical protein